MKKSKFVVPSIIAAGVIPAPATLADSSNHISAEKSLIDEIVHYAQSIEEQNEFTLAGHRSHASHQSHSSHHSHSSHRSYYAPEPPYPGPALRPTQESYQSAALTGRNEASTPRTSVLPKSPMTAKKPKILKGNTGKFADIVTRAQLALLSKGYEPGEIGGELHSRTIAAIYMYQRDNGLPPTGKLGNETLNRLGVTAN